MRFDDVNLAILPFPPVIEGLDFEILKAAFITKLKELLLAKGFTWDMDAIEADPGSAISENGAYRELVVRGRINDAARAVMLAYATAGDLDNLAALYKVARMPGETDIMFRSRVQLAPEALSVAGSRGAYIFHARSLSTDVIDCAAFSPREGVVHVVPLTASNNGRPSAALLDAIRVRLSGEEVRPLTDSVTVLSPEFIEVKVEGMLSLAAGPDGALVLRTALTALAAYAAARRRVGVNLYRSGIIAALTVGGVESVSLSSPVADVLTPEYAVADLVVGTITTRIVTDE